MSICEKYKICGNYTLNITCDDDTLAAGSCGIYKDIESKEITAERQRQNHTGIFSRIGKSLELKQ